MAQGRFNGLAFASDLQYYDHIRRHERGLTHWKSVAVAGAITAVGNSGVWLALTITSAQNTQPMQVGFYANSTYVPARQSPTSLDFSTISGV